MIKSGEIEKKTPYKIELWAEDRDDIKIAEWTGYYSYQSNAELVEVGEIENAVIKDGILSWDSYEGAAYYYVMISDSWGDRAFFDGNTFKVNAKIDRAIKSGDLEKSNTYTVYLWAEDDDGITVAEWTTEYQYNSSATPVEPGKITGVSFKTDGSMTWNAYKGAVEYSVIVDDCSIRINGTNLNLHEEIDLYIKAGYIDKADSYSIAIHAYDKDGILIAEWYGEHEYKSSAEVIEVGTIQNISVSDKGIMSWDAYNGATVYAITVDGCDEFSYSEENSFDLNEFICMMIDGEFLNVQSVYSVEIIARNAEGIHVASGVVTYSFSATDITGKVTVTGLEDKVYTGRALTQSPVVKLGDKTLVEGVDYKIYYEDNVNAGTAEMIIGFKGIYLGVYREKFTIAKANNPLAVKGKTYKVKAKSVKKKKLVVNASKAIVFVKQGNDPKVYKKIKGSSKISVNSKTGKITIKKKTKKGKYKITVRIYGAGNANYNKSSIKTVKFTIKVK